MDLSSRKWWAGFVVGAGVTYGGLVALGHAQLWFGPERKSWSVGIDEDEVAKKFLAELEKDNQLHKFRGQSSTRNFLSTHDSTEERRISRRLFISFGLNKLIGVVRFGADVEGPPRCVHGGASAAVADGCLGVLAHHISVAPCVTANLSVNYRKKIPLGTSVGIECLFVKKEGRKIWLRFRMFELTDQSTVFVDGEALFVQFINVPNPLLVNSSSNELM